jgi:hypothetical protein
LKYEARHRLREFSGLPAVLELSPYKNSLRIYRDDLRVLPLQYSCYENVPSVTKFSLQAKIIAACIACASVS